MKTHVAHIVLVKDSDKHATLQAIKEHCVAKLATNHMLTLVKLYNSTLPVAASGKLDIVKIENDTSDIVEN